MNRGKTLQTLGVGALLCAGSLATDSPAAGFFVPPATRFALIGDTPYAPRQIAQVDEMIREISAYVLQKR